MQPDEKIRELRARLRNIVPQPDERSPARELARWLAAQMQAEWAAEWLPQNERPDPGRFRLMCAQMAACHALEALRERDTATADHVAAQIVAAWSDSGMAEWTWEHLGEDAQAVVGIAGELARLTVAAEAVTAK